MFSDPISITIAGAAKTLNRVSTGDRKATYQTADELWTLTISHQQTGKGNTRTRSLIVLTQKKVVTNPLDSSNDYDTMSYQVVVDRPAFGFSQQELIDAITGFNAWEVASSNAAVAKIYGKES